MKTSIKECQYCDSKKEVKEYRNGDNVKILCCYCARIFGEEDNYTSTMSAMFNLLEERLLKILGNKK